MGTGAHDGATGVGDSPAVVRDGRCGLLVAPADPEALARA